MSISQLYGVDVIFSCNETEEAAKTAAKNSPLYRCFENSFTVCPITIDKMEWTEDFFMME